MTTQISAIELNPELVNMAYEMGLNVSKTCEIALKEAIRRLQGFNLENTSVRNAEAARILFFKLDQLIPYRFRYKLCP